MDPYLHEKTKTMIAEILDRDTSFFTKEDIAEYIEEMEDVDADVDDLKFDRRIRQNIARSKELKTKIEQWKRYAVKSSQIDAKPLPSRHYEQRQEIEYPYTQYDASETKIQPKKEPTTYYGATYSPSLEWKRHESRNETLADEKPVRVMQYRPQTEYRHTQYKSALKPTTSGYYQSPSYPCRRSVNLDPPDAGLSTNYNGRQKLFTSRKEIIDLLKKYLHSINEDAKNASTATMRYSLRTPQNPVLSHCTMKSRKLEKKMAAFEKSEASRQPMDKMVGCLRECCRFYQNFCDLTMEGIVAILKEFVEKFSKFYSFIIFCHGQQKPNCKSNGSKMTECKNKKCIFCNSFIETFLDCDNDVAVTYDLPAIQGNFCEVKNIIYLILNFEYDESDESDECDESDEGDEIRAERYVGKSTTSLKERYPSKNDQESLLNEDSEIFILQQVDEKDVFDCFGWRSLSRFIRTYPLDYLEAIENRWINLITKKGLDRNKQRKLRKFPSKHLERMKLFLRYCFTEESPCAFDKESLKPFTKRIVLYD